MIKTVDKIKKVDKIKTVDKHKFSSPFLTIRYSQSKVVLLPNAQTLG